MILWVYVTVQKDIYKSRERRRGRIQHIYRKKEVLALSGDSHPHGGDAGLEDQACGEEGGVMGLV